MKYLLMAMAAFVLTGCYTRPEHAGRAGDGTYTEVGPNDRNIETRAADNIRDVGRQHSPSAPHLAGTGNGSMNF
jgi:hypothetical protein